MKNLPCLIACSPIVSLVLVTVAASLGVSFPFVPVVLPIVGFSGAAGVLALFLADYAPRSAGVAVQTTEAKRARKPVAQAVVRPHLDVWSNEQSCGGSLTDDALVTLGLCNDPATLSLM